MDDLLLKLKASHIGCYLKGFCFNSVMYADILVILSISISDMQSRLSIWKQSLDELNLEININKSACMRIGPRYDKTNISLVLNGLQLKWKSEIHYLGVGLLAGKSLKFNVQKARNKFYRAANGIFGKLVSFSSPTVLLALIATSCVPVLTMV